MGGIHQESEQFNLRLSSKSANANAQLHQQNDGINFDTADTPRTQILVNKQTSHVRLKEDKRCGDDKAVNDGDELDVDANYEQSYIDNVDVESDIDVSCCSDNNDDDECDGNDDDHGNSDMNYNKNGDVELDIGEHTGAGCGHDDNCDDDEGDNDDDIDDDDGNSVENGDENNDNGDDSDVGARVNDGDDGKDDNNNDDDDDVYRKQAHSSPVHENVSRTSVDDANSAAEGSSVTLPVNRDVQVINTENIVRRVCNNDTGNEKLPVVEGRPFFTNNMDTTNAPLVRNSVRLGDGARPKISASHKSPLRNTAEPDYTYNSKIPSLDEVTGINHGFLARHTTDERLQNTSHPDYFNLPTESTSPTNWPAWSLPPASAQETSAPRQQHPYFRGVHPAVVGYRVTAPCDWQLLNQSQMERNNTYHPSEERRLFNHADPWLTPQQDALARLSLSVNRPGMAGSQSGNSLNTQSWMQSGYESSWLYPGYNFNRSQTSTSSYGGFAARSETFPAVISRAPAIMRPSVPTPVTELPSTANMTSQSVPSSNSPSSALPAFSGNDQDRVINSSRYRPFINENQENNRRLISSEEERPLFPADSSQYSSLAPGSTDYYSLAALERKVSEACAVVERVMREREERTKARREEAQRERERREHRERQAREREERETREREERETREREEREERETREREERETREREERETREREEREAREIREREIRQRRENEEREARRIEGRVAGEWARVQGSPQFQCEHYQRRCSVNFPCCGIFYPCHRCHNRSGACDADDMKANQASHVKCGKCGHQEEINERSQDCSSCGARMSEYFCSKCKHFTGVDKNPFHCNKCGICRIYRDKSFHCDVCNVCLDKRLEGKHKCRPDSGHDECCICLEDAFSGCQILPCPHKVHKDCAIAMIQNGVRNCPICRHPLFSRDSQ